MATIETRLAKLEAAAAVRDTRACVCAGRLRLLWPDGHRAAGDNPGPERCQVCGGLRQTIRVSYGDADNVN